jgi:transglutaminase-like putative cysteine protease
MTGSSTTPFTTQPARLRQRRCRKQLIRGQYGGRSADINGLFVAICRAIGIPARCVYGLRVGPSRLFRSLGLTSDDATRGQHVRAEFYVPGYGWIPVDPSDVRRAICTGRSFGSRQQAAR